MGRCVHFHVRRGKKEVELMRFVLAAASIVMLALPIRVSDAQTAAGTPNAAPAANQPASPAAPPSAQMQPALNAVKESVNSVRVDKWKRGNIRDEAAQNISQIQRDIDVTLPPMLRDADSAPTSLSKLLPVSRNISALYDVLLRVVEASRVIAPDEQVAQLQQALVLLGNARLAFGERMQTAADAMEKQLGDLRATVQSQAAKIVATPTPVAVPCTPPAPKSTTKKTTRKPAAGTPSTKPATTTGAKPPAATGTQPKPAPQQTH
jgi:hypothetical protein